jgi:hypothetical protein
LIFFSRPIHWYHSHADPIGRTVPLTFTYYSGECPQDSQNPGRTVMCSITGKRKFRIETKMTRIYTLLFADIFAKCFNSKEILTNVLQYAITVLQFSVFKQGKIIAKLRRRIFLFQPSRRDCPNNFILSSRRKKCVRKMFK